MDITLKQLLCLIRIVQTGSFTEAARMLHISQPTLSSHIANLEKELGMPLLKRKHNAVVLTPAAKLVYSNAASIVSLIDMMKEELSNVRGLKTGSLRIGGSTIPGTYILPVLIKKFKTLYPCCNVELTIKETDDVIDDILKETIDIGFVGYPPAAPLYQKKCTEDEIILAVHPSHRWAHKSEITLDDLFDEPIIVRDLRSGTQKFFMKALRKKSNRDLKIYSIVNTSEAMKMFVLAGLAPGIISRIAIKNELSSNHIKALPIHGIPLKRPLYLILKNYRNATPFAKSFLKLSCVY